MTTQELFREAQDLFIEGQVKESIEAFTRAHDAGYDPIRTYLSRGTAYLKTTEFDKAIEDFSAVVTLDPNNERGYYYRGIAYLDKQEYESALEDLTHAIVLNPERGVSYFARGLIESELGCEDDALRDFKNAVVYSDTETEGFAHGFGSTPTLFERSMALLEGERGPLTVVLTEGEIKKLEKWMEH